jgi:hypothetical protein
VASGVSTSIAMYIPEKENVSFAAGVRGFDTPNNGYCTVLKMRQFGKHAYRSKFRCRDDDGAKPLIINYTWQIEKDILKVFGARQGMPLQTGTVTSPLTKDD